MEKAPPLPTLSDQEISDYIVQNITFHQSQQPNAIPVQHFFGDVCAHFSKSYFGEGLLLKKIVQAVPGITLLITRKTPPAIGEMGVQQISDAAITELNSGYETLKNNIIHRWPSLGNQQSFNHMIDTLAELSA